ncbi:methyltransferase domain-containing protein [Sulfurimonas aquatica]|uniref:protein-glutamate O-methyltransferase n=1 Tax=Sulfurimonas aquatica TaxID=2672570 RepID=A0A975GD41_9BACT|nr:protein-glutamate O-methyltransferase CheR [Sulfurimonas aquatica]QSZ42290.1 methyltransferase domain-containing protein [Sulfurimonas aquatica]
MGYLLSTENFVKIGEFIYRKSGIHLEEDKHYEKLAKYVEQRSSKLEFDTFRKYFFKLRFDDKSGLEFQELMNAVTVNETYFFREKDQFEVLANNILAELHASIKSDRPIRILSAPCSTGEEPYSIVLHILEERNIVQKRDIEVVGIDIDSTVIKKAKDAKYSERAIHAIPKNILGKWFVKKGLDYSLRDDLLDSVDFQVANVFDKVQMRKLGKFDVIFSRNMLIYFDDASRKEVAMTFYDMLNPDGYVLLGHAEYMSRIVSVFNAKKIENTLIYQK